MELKDLTTYEACILQARAYRVLREFVAKQLDGYGLTMMEWVLLGIVYEAGDKGISPSALSERLDVSLPMVTRMVNGVTQTGYITRTTDQRDRRQQIIVATSEGKERAVSSELRVRKAMKSWLKEVDRVELQGYIRIMAQLAEM